jgi:hypothetical protein
MMPFCYVSPVSSFYFCIYIVSTGTSGNISVAQVYMCMNVYFFSFLELCWWYRCVNNDRQHLTILIQLLKTQVKAKKPHGWR